MNLRGGSLVIQQNSEFQCVCLPKNLKSVLCLPKNLKIERFPLSRIIMTRTLNRIAAMAFASLASAPALAAGASPVGVWQVTTGEARYEVTACGSHSLCAKLVWLAPAARTADNLALLNTYVVKGASPAGAGTWSGSVTLNGAAYAGTMTLVSKNFMTLKGCSGILCQTYEFTRI